MMRAYWNFTFFLHIVKYLDFYVNGGIQFLMYLIWCISALYIFKFDINLFKII
jgi:hypothetical protein